MNEANLVKRLNFLVTGNGVLVEKELDIVAAVRVAASGIPVGAATAPTAAVNGISFANAETAILMFSIPQDYAQNKDQLALRLHEVPSANSADTTSLGITSAQSIFRAGAVVNATASTAKAEAATASTGPNVRENVLDLSGRGYRPGDMIQLTLTATGSGATEIVLLGLDIIYSSCVAAFRDVDRFRKLGTAEV